MVFTWLFNVMSESIIPPKSQTWFWVFIDKDSLWALTKIVIYFVWGDGKHPGIDLLNATFMHIKVEPK